MSARLARLNTSAESITRSAGAVGEKSTGATAKLAGTSSNRVRQVASRPARCDRIRSISSGKVASSLPLAGQAVAVQDHDCLNNPLCFPWGQSHPLAEGGEESRFLRFDHLIGVN